MKENLKLNEKPLEFYNPTSGEYSSDKKDGFYPLMMWTDGRLSELLYQKGDSVCYGTLPVYRFDEDTAMALSTSKLRYTTKETFERFMKKFQK